MGFFGDATSISALIRSITRMPAFRVDEWQDGQIISAPGPTDREGERQQAVFAETPFYKLGLEIWSTASAVELAILVVADEADVQSVIEECQTMDRHTALPTAVILKCSGESKDTPDEIRAAAISVLERQGVFVVDSSDLDLLDGPALVSFLRKQTYHAFKTTIKEEYEAQPDHWLRPLLAQRRPLRDVFVVGSPDLWTWLESLGATLGKHEEGLAYSVEERASDIREWITVGLQQKRLKQIREYGRSLSGGRVTRQRPFIFFSVASLGWVLVLGVALYYLLQKVSLPTAELVRLLVLPIWPLPVFFLGMIFAFADGKPSFLRWLSGRVSRVVLAFLLAIDTLLLLLRLRLQVR
ncbi:MAG: hypothetical protein HN348_33615, partial [Proteobacteria bacterium]|nr:hypothetical protein [Pseudomonadota bacterium]